VISVGGQLNGNVLPGSLPHKSILFVTLIICFVVNKFLSIAPMPAIAAWCINARVRRTL